MLFFLDHPGLVVFDDSLKRHPRSSSEDSLQLHPLIGLSKALGTGFVDTPYSSL